jgi:hypothetical protein
MILGAGIVNYAFSHANGITGRTLKPGSTNGCTCHCANSSSATSVSISTSATVFEAGQTYNFTVTVTNTNENQAGVDIAVGNGTLSPTSNNLQNVGGELTHTAPVNLPASFTFQYTVPNSGTTDAIYVTGNAVNGDGMNDGGNCTDNWNNASTFNITIATRAVGITRNSIAFGSKRTGTPSVSDTLRIVSTGEATLTVNSSGMKNSAPFSASPTGTNRTISAGSQELNTITFNPNAKGSYVDTFVVNSNATAASDQRKTVVVTGTAVQAIFTGGTTMDFNIVKINTTKDLQYTIQNTGDDTLFLNQSTPLTVTGSAFTLQSPPGATTILPGASTNFTVRFSPTAKQAYSGSVTFSTLNSITAPTVNLTGNGGAPQISTAPSLDAGNVKVNTQSFATLNVTNTGNDTLHVSNVTISGPQSSKFSVSGSPIFQVLPSQTQPVNIGYSPNQERRDTAIITIASDDAVSPSRQVTVVGKGVVPIMAVTPTDTVNFGDVRIGGSSTNSSIKIANSGEIALAIQNVTVSPATFTKESAPNQLQAGASGNVSIKFTPLVEGTVTGSVIITSDDPKNPSDTVYLKARGTKSQIDYVSSVNFGNVRVNATRDTTVKIRNLGSASVAIKKYTLTDTKGVFTITDSSKHTIGAHDSISVGLRFTAKDELSYNGNLSLTTDEPSGGTISINLSGRGINSKLIVEPSDIDFGEVDTLKTKDSTFTIKNSGTAATTITNLTYAGSNAFSFTSQKTAPFSLLPDSLVTITVHFAPTIVEDESGTITITASEGTPIDVTLHGKGKEVQTGGVKDGISALLTVRVHPNPAAVSANLTLTSPQAMRLGLHVYDIAGKSVGVVQSIDVTPGSNEIMLPVERLSNGMYFLRVTNDGMLIGEATIMIVK